MPKLLVGNHATQQCLQEIKQLIPLNHPDFLHLKPPHTIANLDKWLGLIQTSPLQAQCRYGFLQDADELSEIALGRMLDILENAPHELLIWISSRGILHPTIHSRVMAYNAHGKSQNLWNQILCNCKKNLSGSTNTADWKEWKQVLFYYRCYIHRFPEYQWLDLVKQLRITQI